MTRTCLWGALLCVCIGVVIGMAVAWSGEQRPAVTHPTSGIPGGVF